MKKLLLVTSILTFSLSFSQSSKTKFVNLPKEKLYNMFKNSGAAKNQYAHLTEQERKEQFEEYYCMIKKYKRDFSEDSNFTSEEQAEKRLNEIFSSPDSVKPEVPAVEFLDIIYHLQMGEYHRRIDFYKNNKKCLRKDNYVW